MARTRVGGCALRKSVLLLVAAITAVIASPFARAQLQPRGLPNPDQAAARGSGPAQGANPLFGQAAGPQSNSGGGAQADFDSLIQLIQSTVAPDSWEEAGGRGSVQPFPTGVYVDAQGVLRRALRRGTSPAGHVQLASIQHDSKSTRAAEKQNPRRPSALRKVSLTRLERAVARRLAAGKPLDDAMLVMAGLERAQYLFVLPDSGDLVLAGPADDWSTSEDGRVVSVTSGRPLLRLDDFVVLWRRFSADAKTPLGCAITPRADRLAALQTYLNATSAQPLKPGQRDRWLEEMRSRVGRQDIEFFGLDPSTRVAQVLLEADYHMKLVGIGLEPGTPGLKSYLASIEVRPGESPPPLEVLRWWFTLDEAALAASPDGKCFELTGTGVRVLSENEILAARGQRVHTGAAEPLNRAFAAAFTAHFDELARKYPVYAELQNVFHLALCAALIDAEALDDIVAWEGGCFADQGSYAVPRTAVPETVESVANLRVIQRKHVLAVVSGGVSLDAAVGLRQSRTVRPASVDGTLRSQPTAPTGEDGRWWWD